MGTANKNAPTIVGAVLLVVGVVGARLVVENTSSYIHWLRSLAMPFSWRFGLEGAPFDVYIGYNLVPVMFVLLAAGLIRLVNNRVVGGFVPLFLALWGAVVAAGIASATLSVLYNDLVLDIPSFTPNGQDSFLDTLHFGIDTVLDGAAFAGMWVALAVAITAAVAAPSPPAASGYAANPYSGGPLDPSPPMTPTPPPTTPLPATPPPPTSSSPDPTVVGDGYGAGDEGRS